MEHHEHLKDYFKYYESFTNKYPKNQILICMQIGSFYESYETDNAGPDLRTVSQITGVITKEKGGSRDSNLKSSLKATKLFNLGFPVNSLFKYLDILINNNYIVVIVDQVFNKTFNSVTKKIETRKISNVYSKGTYIENLSNNNDHYIMYAYISRDKQPDGSALLSAGLSAIDVSTGKVLIHEAYSNKHDEYLALDETDRFISSLDPKEIIIYFQDNVKQPEKSNFKERIQNYLKLDDESCVFYETMDNKYFQLNVQNELLVNVYKECKTMVSPIEFIGIEKNVYAIVALVSMFDYICDRNTELLANIKPPNFFMSNSHLVLGNNALSQLDVFPSDKSTVKIKDRSLFHVVNKTSTAMGERLLRSNLLSPSVNVEYLEQIYDRTSALIKNKTYEGVEKYLLGIRDIERLQKKIELGILRPAELNHLLTSYENIQDLAKFIKKDFKKLKKILPSKSIIESMSNFKLHVNNIFNTFELFEYSILDFETNIFNNGIHTDVDELFNNVSFDQQFIEKIRVELTNILNTSRKKGSDKFITLQNTKKTGSYLKLTISRSKLLRQMLYEDNVPLIIDEKPFDVNKLNFFSMNDKNDKITLGKSENKIDDPKKHKDKITKLCRHYYIFELRKINELFSGIFDECNKFISQIDFLKSNAKVADNNGYVKPVVTKSAESYIKATGLRHPIIEKLINYEYIPHDIDLGSDLKGMMIYGLNSSGKSSVMKAIGLSVIMAQAGLFVPCDTMELGLYDSLYTRITGEDNIFRGLSSFSLEMVELNAILKRANKNALVIGDEVCRGTEHISGNSLVAAALITLSESRSTFIFASHLHEIMEFDEIKNLSNVKAYHLSVLYDQNTQSLTFDRQMKEGSGKQIYGVTVAQYIIQDKKFIDLAVKFRNKLTDSYDGLLSGKTSKYNNNVLIYKCGICGCDDKTLHISNLETHHINFQKNCKDGIVKNKKHLKKNDQSNLIVLCDCCHNSIHAGQLTLDKYVMTSEGKKILIKNK